MLNMTEKKTVKDVFYAYLVEGATFDGKYEFPTLNNYEGDLPSSLVGFSKRNQCKTKTESFVNFYILDEKFTQLERNPKKYLDELKEFAGVIEPDYSIYRDMPFGKQIGQAFKNRSLAYYFQKNGINVIPNVRWSDERSYEFCFSGLKPNGIYCIGSLGCLKQKVNRAYFKAGLKEFIDRLNPQIVLVYGAMPDDIFGEYKDRVNFIQYESQISQVFKDRSKTAEVE